MFLSVILPVRNEANFIQHTLSQLVSQDYDPAKFEILVVDGQSTDNTPALVEAFARQHADKGTGSDQDDRCLSPFREQASIRLLHNPKRLSSAARNVGVRQARGDVVLIVDGHCEIPDDRMLSKLADAFETSGADCIGRPQPLDIRDATPLQRAIAAARSHWLGHHPSSYIYSSQPQFVPAGSVAVAYRRSVFEKVGYFDETFDACEDYELNHRIDRAGHRCYFTPDVAVRYQPRNSLRGLFRQLVRYGRGRVRMLRKHPETLALTTLMPALFVAGCVNGPLVAWLWAPLLTVYVALLLLYTTLVLSVSTGLAIRYRDIRLLPWLPLVFPTVHFAAGTGLILEALYPRRTPGHPSTDN